MRVYIYTYIYIEREAHTYSYPASMPRTTRIRVEASGARPKLSRVSPIMASVNKCVCIYIYIYIYTYIYRERYIDR